MAAMAIAREILRKPVVSPAIVSDRSQLRSYVRSQEAIGMYRFSDTGGLVMPAAPGWTQVI